MRKLIINVLFISTIVCSQHTFAAPHNKDVIAQKIAATARVQGEDPVLLLAIAVVESNLSPEAIGALGELGLFQLRPEFHDIQLTDQVEKQTRTAIAYLRELKRVCSSKYIQCWNMGPTRTKQLNIKKTSYERKVSNAYQKIIHRGRVSSRVCSVN